MSPNKAQQDAQQNAQQEAAPRRLPQKKKQPSVPELVVEMQDWFKSLERSVAGFNSLNLALLSYQGQIPEGERKKGLPVFTFPASVNGRDTIEVVADIKRVAQMAPSYVPHVLIPLINAQQADMLEAVDEIGTRVDMLKQVLSAILAQQQEAVADDVQEHAAVA